MRLAPLGHTQAQRDSPWSRVSPITRNARNAPLEAPSKKSLFIARQGAAAVAALLVGTGGLGTACYVVERNQRGYRFGDFEYGVADSLQQSARIEEPGASENLLRVKSVFEPNVTELASLFNVSRQSIYNWQGGQAIAPENEQRLARLRMAADLIDAHGLARKVSVLRRVILDGKNFFELVRTGSDPEAIARTLIGTISREAEQRKRLDARLANRPRRPIDAGEIGSPHFDEKE